MTDLAFAGIAELAAAYRNGQETPLEAVETALGRIEKLDEKLGAYQAVYADDARAAAEAAGKAIASGHRIGPFHGVPFALKDLVDIEGRITTGGCWELRERISPPTGTIARRLIAAGGILLGKTKTVELAYGAWGTNTMMGTPWNPWDEKEHRIPGGSSSGSGVAVASGLATCAVGTDTGGSVRIPAAWCGIVGLKTTEALLPTDGIMPLSHTLDTPGPMTRSVVDAALMFEVMSGREAWQIEHEHGSRTGLYGLLQAGVRGLSLGVISDRERDGVDAETLAHYDEAMALLRKLGAETFSFEAPLAFDDMKLATGIIIGSEGYVHQGMLYGDPARRMDEHVRPRIMAGRDVPAHQYVSVLLQRKRHQAEFEERMRGLAALMTPTMVTQPLLIDQVDQTQTPTRFTRPGNYLALCGLTVPMALSDSGLPISLQVLGRGRDEAMALRIGAAFEAAAKPIGRPPLALV